MELTQEQLLQETDLDLDALMDEDEIDTLFNWINTKVSQMQLPVIVKTAEGKKEFYRGYYCAVAVLLRLYDEPTLAEQIIGENFYDISELKTIGVDEQDIEKLKPVIKEYKRKQKYASRFSE